LRGASVSFRNLVSLNPTWQLDQVYMLPRFARMTGIAKLRPFGEGQWDVRFLPARVADDSTPHMLAAADPRFAEVAEFIAQSSRDAGLRNEIEIDGNELLIRSRR
jgi:hypothetical protein